MAASTCPSSCPWVGTPSCTLHQLKGTIRDQTRLSLGQLEGLKGMYHPHPLPPCVNGEGYFQFTSMAFDTLPSHSIAKPEQLKGLGEESSLEHGAFA